MTKFPQQHSCSYGPGVERKNHYDRFDVVARDAALIADGAGGQLKVAAYRVRDPENGEWGPLQFHMTHGNTVLAVMGAEAAKLFTRFVRQTTGEEPRRVDPLPHPPALAQGGV